MPAGVPPHKEVPGEIGPELRWELCRAAVEGDERFSVSRWEVEKAEPAYTHETLEHLAGERPGDELVFVLGGDQARDLPAWRDPEAVLALARLGVVEREGARRAAIEERLAGLEGGDGVEFFTMPEIDLSSTLVRQRVAAGRPIRYLVPAGVEAMIAERGLYV